MFKLAVFVGMAFAAAAFGCEVVNGRRVLYWTRVSYFLVFGYMNAVVSAYFAYFKSIPGVFDLVLGVCVAWIQLLLGILVITADNRGQPLGESERDIRQDTLHRLFLGSLFAIGFNLANAFLHLTVWK